MTSEKTVLDVKNLSVQLGAVSILKDLNFTVRHGEVLAVVGPNGSGKSVLLRTLLGLLPYTGTYKWAAGLRISYIPQHFTIDKDLPLSVGEFMRFKTNNTDKIIGVLRNVGIVNKESDEHHVEHHVLRQRVGYLSGGQMQRMLIAWSLLDDPDVLIYDEPTSGIDIGGEETVFNLLRRVHNLRQLTIILVSHELSIVYKYATTVICINNKMVCYGSPHEALDPQALAQLYGGEANFYRHAHDHGEITNHG